MNQYKITYMSQSGCLNNVIVEAGNDVQAKRRFKNDPDCSYVEKVILHLPDSV